MAAKSLQLLENLIQELSTPKPTSNRNVNEWALNLSVQQIFSNFPNRFWEFFVIRSKYQSIIAPFRRITEAEAVKVITNIRGNCSSVSTSDNGVRALIGSTLYELKAKFVTTSNIDTILLYDIAAILGIHPKEVKPIIKGFAIIDIPEGVIKTCTNEQFLQRLSVQLHKVQRMKVFTMEIFDNKNNSTKEIWIGVASIFTEIMFRNLVDPVGEFFCRFYDKNKIKKPWTMPKMNFYDHLKWKKAYTGKINESLVKQCICGKELKRKKAATQGLFSVFTGCDICNNKMNNKMVWHCDKNVEHPGGYDICDDCLNQCGIFAKKQIANSENTETEEKKLNEEGFENDNDTSTIQDVEFEACSLDFLESIQLVCKPDNSNYGLWISSIDEKAPRFVKDHLKIGVQILEINERDVTCMQFNDAMDLWNGMYPLKVKYRPLNHPNYIGQNVSNSAFHDIPKNARYHLFKVFGLLSMVFYCMAIGDYLDGKYKLMRMANYSYGFYIANIALIYYIWTGLDKRKNIILILFVFIIYGIVQGITIKNIFEYMSYITAAGKESKNKDEDDQFCWGMIFIGMFFMWFMIMPFITGKQIWMFLGVLVCQLMMVTEMGFLQTSAWWVNVLIVALCMIVMIGRVQRLLSPRRIFNDDKYGQLDYVIDASNFFADVIVQTLSSASRRY